MKSNGLEPNGIATKGQSLSPKDFQRLSAFIHSECGIKMPDVKKIMLESRLNKRLRSLGKKNFSEYCDYVFGPEGAENERGHLIDAVTTNKTEFFRESAHFERLVDFVLPDLITNRSEPGDMMVWSAGCSSGEEPYTLAMVLSEFAAGTPGFRFRIIATDICNSVLETAANAVYSEEKITPVPEHYRTKYIMWSKNRARRMVRIVPEIRSAVKFRRLNFMEADFGFRERMDIIFCRNVIIYFDRQTQERLINRFCGHLRPGGYLFLGHSETLNGLNVLLRQAAPTIYRKEA